MKEPNNTSLNDYIGEDDVNYYILRAKSKVGFGGYHEDYILESHNKKSLNVNLSKDVEVKVNGIDADVNRMLMLNQQIYGIVELYNKKQDQHELYIQQVDKSSLQFTGTPKLLMKMPAKSKKSEGSFSEKISRNHNNVAIFGYTGDEQNVNQRFSIAVTDDHMSVLWKKEITLPYDSHLFVTERNYCDNDGNVYILGRLYKDVVKEKRSGSPNYVYKLLAYRDQGSSSKEYTISLKDNFITDLSFGVTDDGKLICAGFYSTKGTFSIKGTYAMQIDVQTGEVLRDGTKDFGPDFIDMFRPKEKEKAKDDKDDSKEDKKEKAPPAQELQDFDLDDVIPRSDGGALLIAEQYYTTTYTTQSYNSATHSWSYTTHILYHYNHLIAVNVNSDLRIDWAVKIPKSQASEGGAYYLSYAKAISGNKIYFIFNDNEKNLLETDPKKVASYDGKSSIATLVTLTDDGNWKKSYIFSNKDEGVILRPVVCKQMSDNQMFLYAEKGKNYILGTVTF